MRIEELTVWGSALAFLIGSQAILRGWAWLCEAVIPYIE